jgi:hypothetical protein
MIMYINHCLSYLNQLTFTFYSLAQPLLSISRQNSIFFHKKLVKYENLG